MCEYLYDEELEEWRQLRKIKKAPSEPRTEPVPVEVIALE
jgi:hypothetical protein